MVRWLATGRSRIPLRRSPLTPASLETRRRNAQKSTGPRTAGGKAQVRLHALKHGRRSARFAAYVAERLHLDPKAMLRLPAMGAGPVVNVLMSGWLARECGPQSRERLQFERQWAAEKRRTEIEFIEESLTRYAALARLPSGVVEPLVALGSLGPFGVRGASEPWGTPGRPNATPEVATPNTAQMTTNWEKVVRRLTGRLGVLRRAEARAAAKAGMGAASPKADKQTWKVASNQPDKKSTFGPTGQ